MWRGHDSVFVVGEEQKHANSPSMQALGFLGGARPLLFPCLAERDAWPTTPVFGILGPWSGHPCLHSAEIAPPVVQRGHVFTPGPWPRNPSVLLCSRDAVPLLTRACA